MRIIAVVLLIVCATPAFAITCEKQTPEQVAGAAEIAFVGTVTSVVESDYKPMELCWDRSSGSRCGGKLGTFRVTESIRGQLTSSVTVLKEDGCYCTGGYWKVGSSYLVVAKPNTTKMPGQLIASNVCGGTVELSDSAQPFIKALKDAKK